jgi:CheY-like chemotaxis protein
LAPVRLLLVDDDEAVRSGLQGVLEASEFEVVTASDVNEALQRIASESFDVLLTDLHMPGAGDGLTVVSAMRHANPKSVTILLSANPDMAKAAEAIRRQIDEIVRKPVKVSEIIEVIRQRLEGDTPSSHQPREEPLAILLERETASITQAWIAHLQRFGQTWTAASGDSLSIEERCKHLPDALRDIIFRLRYPQTLGARSIDSMAALQHGARRRRQGIGVASMVEEARALQAAIFEVMQKNLDRVDLGQLPGALMAIADEVNAQLLQSITGYENEQPAEVYQQFD